MKLRFILISIICLLTTAGVFSQITLNSNNFPVGGLQIGRGYVLAPVNVLGNAGPNQFYDFTNVTPVIHDSVKYYASAQTLWASFHPGATVANAEVAGNLTYVYYCTSGTNAYSRTGLTLIGDFGQGMDTVHGNYSNPDTILSNQFTYGYSKTEFSVVTIPNALPLVNYQIKTKRNILVDGWGQLETPLNYYPDVLRVKCAEYRYDTAFYLTSPVYTVADTQYYYNYYAKDVRHPVVKAHTDKLYNLLYFEYIYTAPVIVGCMDTMAVNYNPMANMSDGSCEYCSVSYSITPDTTICEGASITLTISGGSNYLWSDGTTGSSISMLPDESSVYSAYVSDSTGCWALASVEVTVDKPVTAVFWTTIDHYNTGDMIQYVNLSVNASHYNWSFDDAVDGYSNQQYPQHTYTIPGMKHIELIAHNTCFTDSIMDSLKIYDGTYISNNSLSDDFNIYPNPGTSLMTIEGNFDESANLEIDAIDILGRRKHMASHENISGIFRLENDLTQLSLGIYVIEIIHGEKKITHKWVKMK